MDFKELDDYAMAVVKSVGELYVGRVLRVHTLEYGYTYAQYQYSPNVPGSFITPDGAVVTPISYRVLTDDEASRFFERGYFQKKYSS